MDIVITEEMRAELKAFADIRGSYAQAAYALGVNPSTFSRWMKGGSRVEGGKWLLFKSVSGGVVASVAEPLRIPCELHPRDVQTALDWYSSHIGEWHKLLCGIERGEFYYRMKSNKGRIS